MNSCPCVPVLPLPLLTQTLICPHRGHVDLSPTCPSSRWRPFTGLLSRTVTEGHGTGSLSRRRQLDAGAGVAATSSGERVSCFLCWLLFFYFCKLSMHAPGRSSALHSRAMSCLDRGRRSIVTAAFREACIAGLLHIVQPPVSFPLGGRGGHRPPHGVVAGPCE